MQIFETAKKGLPHDDKPFFTYPRDGLATCEPLQTIGVCRSLQTIGMRGSLQTIGMRDSLCRASGRAGRFQDADAVEDDGQGGCVVDDSSPEGADFP